MSSILDCMWRTSSTNILGTESRRAFLWSVCTERCLCPARLAGPLLHPLWLCLLGYYTSTSQSALSKRSCSNPCKSRLHWRKWLCSVHKCLPCVLTRTMEALRQCTLYPQAASQVTGSGLQLGRLCSGRGRRVKGGWRTPGSPHVSMPVVSVQTWKIWNTGMIHERWNFHPGSIQNMPKTEIIHVNT